MASSSNKSLLPDRAFSHTFMYFYIHLCVCVYNTQILFRLYVNLMEEISGNYMFTEATDSCVQHTCIYLHRKTGNAANSHGGRCRTEAPTGFVLLCADVRIKMPSKKYLTLCFLLYPHKPDHSTTHQIKPVSNVQCAIKSTFHFECS